MPKNKYIAIDLGAESGRVMLGQLSPNDANAGSAIHLTEIHRFPNIQISLPFNAGKSTRLHWDLLRLFSEIKLGLAKVADNHNPEDIAGIGVDTWGVDFALLDHNGELLANPVAYRDARTTGIPEQLFQKIPQQNLYAITGIQTMFLNTLFQLAALSYANSPQLAAAQHLLFLPDLLTYWLSGVMGTDYTIASTSQMLDAQKRTWSPEALRAIGGGGGGVTESLFSPISIPGQKNSLRGTLLPIANEKLSGAKIPIIAVGGHDTACAVAAVPTTSDHWLYLSSGTWSLLGAEIDEPVLTPLAAQHNVTNEGGVGGKIRLLKNLAGLWLLQECRREWSAQGTEYDYSALTKMAEAATPRLARLNVEDPTFSSPGNMLQKITTHCTSTNQTPPQTPGEFARVILESLAHTYAQTAAQLSAITGQSFSTLHIVGGGSQNNLLNQLAANATRMTVIAGPVEATALGNILTQAITIGAIPTIAEGRKLIANSTPTKTFHPQK